MTQSLFLDFNLPNSPTWFYFSLFLTAALFLQFNRILALRNWDLLALFLFVPGFILIQEANTPPAPPWLDNLEQAARERFIGYLWLLGASAFWFARCLLDLATVRRPLLCPNLNAPGLIWFGSALFVCLTAVGFTRTDDPWGPVGKRPAILAGVEQGAAAVVAKTQDDGPSSQPRVLDWVERAFALACHAAVVGGLILIGLRHFHDLQSGVASATLYLLLPYTAFFIGQVHHVWPAALIVWAVFFYGRPSVAGGFLGVAAGTAFFPVLLVPVWLQFYRGCGVGRFSLAFLAGGAAGLAATLLVLTLAGQFPEGVWRTLTLADWQPWLQPESESVWQGVHWAYRLPVFIAYAGFVLTAWIWPPVRNLGQLVAVSAAVIIGVQFWYADRGGLYVLWYAPLLILVVFRPTLSDLRPLPPGPGPGLLARTAVWTWNRVRPGRPTSPETAVAP